MTGRTTQPQPEEPFVAIPAIDILGGRGVRLYQGAYDRVTDYGDPLTLAQRWAAYDVPWLHVVDLDGARRGAADALATAATIKQSTGCRVQFGGGIRSPEQVAAALAQLDRVIVSSWALREPDACKQVLERYPGRVLISLDIRDGKAWIDGWKTKVDADPAQLAQSFYQAGAAGVIVTQIDRDGTLQGVDPAAVAAVRAWGVPFWWAGGIGADEDVLVVAKHGAPLARGAIIGKALYAGRVSLPDLLRKLAALH